MWICSEMSPMIDKKGTREGGVNNMMGAGGGHFPPPGPGVPGGRWTRACLVGLFSGTHGGQVTETETKTNASRGDPRCVY